ncbi:hypothetical protein TCDM_12132 [Trypanosoma cruzi Dm28c]|uniref:Uncharacterized protein n=1 Tax=Trypanosoma cruzi Dm28c TaxID=1416333 RepID=V5CYN4_TRYCR|nr:hypothetical protein TCDM_12132 [Trypanosoma cruzi Dm28c]
MICGTEEKEWNRRERNRAQRIQREGVDNTKRGQQAQQHSSHTTRRHPPPPSPPAHFHNPREVAESPAATAQRTMSKRTLTHPQRGTKFTLPSSPHWNTEPNPTQPQEKRRGLRTPSLLPSPHGHGKRQQPPHATTSMHYKISMQIHCNVHRVCVCVCLCVPAETQRKEAENGSIVCGETHKHVQQRCMVKTT